MALSGPRYPNPPLIEDIPPKPSLPAQRFVSPIASVRGRSGEVRFTSSDTVNTTVKPLGPPITVERVIIMNRSSDDAGVATAGNAILVGNGPNAFGQQIPVGGAVELLNVNLADIAVAYSGTVSLAGAAIVIVGWTAHGLIAVSHKDMTAVQVTERI